MSKKKSLGSSPIGYSSLGRESFEFIPTITKPDKTVSSQSLTSEASNNAQTNGNQHYSQLSVSGENVEKRIVSYYLEEHLVERLKRVADERKMYYSTLVNHAIYLWLESRGFD